MSAVGPSKMEARYSLSCPEGHQGVLAKGISVVGYETEGRVAEDGDSLQLFEGTLYARRCSAGWVACTMTLNLYEHREHCYNNEADWSNVRCEPEQKHEICQ